MPKIKKSAGVKIRQIIREYSNEFSEAPNEKLFCFLCSTNIAFEKNHFVAQHRQTAQHQRYVAQSSKPKR